MEYIIIALAVVIAVLCTVIIIMLSKRGGTHGLDNLTDLVKTQDMRLDRRLESVEGKLDTRLESVEVKLDARLANMDAKLTKQVEGMMASNEKRLDEIRTTVDEKLSSTLKTRLDSSFGQVSQQLERVYKGLGEVQSLATDVGDLKKVMSNVKSRGIWGEIQLGTLLEQMLAKNQYAENIAVNPKSADRVEFAIILPSKDDPEKPVYIPIDSKFPIEDYQRLVTAQEGGDKGAVEAAYKALENAIKAQAKKIKEKYICPPYTTDFAIMFLPTESLFAEVLRRGALCEGLQRDFSITVTGPTTLSALLSSLQVGFKTLAIEQRSADVWRLLGTIKADFDKFGEILEKTQKKLDQARDEIESATKRTHTIQRHLKNVQSLPENTVQLSEDDAYIDDGQDDDMQ